MKLWDKFKNINKKWYLLLIAVLILGIAGGIIVKKSIKYRYARLRSREAPLQAFQQVCMDLIYLEKFQTLKVTPEQAKEILPLVDQLSAAGSSSKPTLAKQIYGTLTPQQYEILLERQDILAGGRERERYHKRGFHGERDFDDWFFHGGRESGEQRRFLRDRNHYWDAKQQALGDVVIRMLRIRSAEKSAAKTSGT